MSKINFKVNYPFNLFYATSFCAFSFSWSSTALVIIYIHCVEKSSLDILQNLFYILLKSKHHDLEQSWPNFDFWVRKWQEGMCRTLTELIITVLMWIPIGVFAVWEGVQKKVNNRIPSPRALPQVR